MFWLNWTFQRVGRPDFCPALGGLRPPSVTAAGTGTMVI
jgi:hypothetical protein